MCRESSSSALSRLLPSTERGLGKGQPIAVGTIIQTDCRSPPPFTINLALTFLMVVAAINGGRESGANIKCAISGDARWTAESLLKGMTTLNIQQPEVNSLKRRCI